MELYLQCGDDELTESLYTGERLIANKAILTGAFATESAEILRKKSLISLWAAPPALALGASVWLVHEISHSPILKFCVVKISQQLLRASQYTLLHS